MLRVLSGRFTRSIRAPASGARSNRYPKDFEAVGFASRARRRSDAWLPCPPSGKSSRSSNWADFWETQCRCGGSRSTGISLTSADPRSQREGRGRGPDPRPALRPPHFSSRMSRSCRLRRNCCLDRHDLPLPDPLGRLPRGQRCRIIQQRALDLSLVVNQRERRACAARALQSQ